jgi:hypothetical protein
MTSIAQRQILIGLQTDPGTGVTPDVALRALLSLKPAVDKIKVEENIGSYAPARHYVGSVMPEGTLTVDGLYQEVPYVLAMAMGAETPSGGGSPYTWTWDLPDDAANTFALFTVEYTDGGTWVVRAEDVFASALTISGEAGKSWLFEAELTGGETTYPDALTATLSPGTTLTPIRMADTNLYVDSTYAGIGGTLATGTLISFTWKLESLQHVKQFAGSVYPNGRGNAVWKTSLELVVEAGSAAMDGDRDNLLDTIQSAIRVKAASGSFSAAIDGMYMLEDVDTLDERDGNNTVKMTYAGEKDSLDNTGSVVVLSSLAAL